MRVLIAEDEKKVCHFIRKALREGGYAVDTVHDGDAALERASTLAYDVIVLDIMMPGRDGLSVLKLLRAERSPTRGGKDHGGRLEPTVARTKDQR